MITIQLQQEEGWERSFLLSGQVQKGRWGQLALPASAGLGQLGGVL